MHNIITINVYTPAMEISIIYSKQYRPYPRISNFNWFAWITSADCHHLIKESGVTPADDSLWALWISICDYHICRCGHNA